MVKHREVDIDENSDGDLIDGGVKSDYTDNTSVLPRPNKAGSLRPMKSKQKSKNQKSQSKLMKSLRENEIEENKLFLEHVEVKENFYFCKVCNKFSSATKMRTKTHVLSCGKIKKMGRPRKLSKCLLCLLAERNWCNTIERSTHVQFIPAQTV